MVDASRKRYYDFSVMSIFPKTITGNLIAVAVAAGVLLFSASQCLPEWMMVAAIICIGVNILVAIVRALSWCLGEYPKTEKRQIDQRIEITIWLKHDDEHR